MTEWSEMKALEGKYVKVTLDYENDEAVYGTLVFLSDDGEVMLANDGVMSYSWPAIDIEEFHE